MSFQDRVAANRASRQAENRALREEHGNVEVSFYGQPTAAQQRDMEVLRPYAEALKASAAGMATSEDFAVVFGPTAPTVDLNPGIALNPGSELDARAAFPHVLISSGPENIEDEDRRFTALLGFDAETHTPTMTITILEDLTSAYPHEERRYQTAQTETMDVTLPSQVVECLEQVVAGYVAEQAPALRDSEPVKEPGFLDQVKGFFSR